MKRPDEHPEDPAPCEPPFDAAAALDALARCAGSREHGSRDLLAQLSRLRGDVSGALQRLRIAHHDAQDAVADALLALFEDALGGRWQVPPRSWRGRLFWKARTCLYKARRRAREVSLDAPHASAHDLIAPDVWEPLLTRDHIAHLVATRLTPCERHVVMGRLAGLTYREIAALGRTSIGSARTHFVNALAKLKEAA